MSNVPCCRLQGGKTPISVFAGLRRTAPAAGARMDTTLDLEGGLSHTARLAPGQTLQSSHFLSYISADTQAVLHQQSRNSRGGGA